MEIIGIGNPEKYKNDQINENVKQTYEEIREHDNRRIDAIQHITGIKIRIVWEADYLNDYNEKLLNDLINWIYVKE